VSLGLLFRDTALDLDLQGPSEQWDKEQIEVTPLTGADRLSVEVVPFIPSSQGCGRDGFGELQKLPPSVTP